MTNGTQSGSATNARPIVADVYATLVDGEVKFDHDWRFEGDPTGKKGIIDVPPGGSGTPPARIYFRLHDNSGLNLKFINPPRDAMWVSQSVKCPKKRGTGGQISYPHAWEADVLKVQDANSGDECLLYYTLRFDGDPHTDPNGTHRPPFEYDPTIKNGGGTTPLTRDFLSTGTIIAAVAVVAVIAVLYFWFR